MAFTSLAYLKDVDWLKEAYRRTRKECAVGADGVSAGSGGPTLEIRPLGIPTLENKLLQSAVVMLLEPIYEQNFLDCSYGLKL